MSENKIEKLAEDINWGYQKSFERFRNGTNSEVKKKKPDTEAYKAYVDKVNTVTIVNPTDKQIKQVIMRKLHRNAKGPKGFDPNEAQKALMTDLFWYFKKDKAKTNPTIDTSKGICISGKYGVGKTEILRAFITTKFEPHRLQDAEKTYRIVSASQIVERYNQTTSMREFLFKDLMLDDLGAEPFAKFDKRDDQKLLARFIEMWYAESREHKLYITTNLSKAQLEHRYGERSYSRLNALCNLINYQESTDYRMINHN